MISDASEARPGPGPYTIIAWMTLLSDPIVFVHRLIVLNLSSSNSEERRQVAFCYPHDSLSNGAPSVVDGVTGPG